MDYGSRTRPIVFSIVLGFAVAIASIPALIKCVDEEQRNKEKIDMLDNNDQCISIYEIKKEDTNEVKNIIGIQIDEFKILNYETFQIENYDGDQIQKVDYNFDKNNYEYHEILEIIENYRQQNRPLSKKIP